MAISNAPTKRNIVRVVGKICDPLGILPPVVFQFKTFLQELCHVKINWDQLIPDNLMKIWQSLISSHQEG